MMTTHRRQGTPALRFLRGAARRFLGAALRLAGGRRLTALRDEPLGDFPRLVAKLR